MLKIVQQGIKQGNTHGGHLTGQRTQWVLNRATHTVGIKQGNAHSRHLKNKPTWTDLYCVLINTASHCEIISQKTEHTEPNPQTG